LDAEPKEQAGDKMKITRERTRLFALLMASGAG
jgi:hypothetical protein